MAVADASLILRDGSTNLNATGNGSFVNVGYPPAQGLTVRIEYPQVPTGTTPTCDLTIETSDDGTNPTGDKLVLKQETAATLANPASRFVSIEFQHPYIRWNATVGGTTPNFGKVWIGVDAGELKQVR